MKTDLQIARKNSGGRPSKFSEPSRPVTLTLPESTLRDLQHVDPDRGRAIVKLAKQALDGNGAIHPPVEIVEMATNMGLVLVGPSRALRRVPFLHLVELAPSRYLLALDPGNDFKNLEIALSDALDDVEQDDIRERDLIVQLIEHMKRLRKGECVSMAEILFVKLNGKDERRENRGDK